MFGAQKFRRWLQHPGFNGSKGSPPPPDYTPLANASAESAQIMAGLGQQQLDFAKQQYNDVKPFLTDIAQQQQDISNQAAAQGQDYYDYQKSFRPVEQQMLTEAMDPSQQAKIDAYDAANKADAATITQNDAALYDANKAQVDPAVAQAVADSQGGYSRALNQAIRQGLRYGAATPQIVGQVGSIGLAQASNTAAAANGARTAAIQNVRDRAAQGLTLRQQNQAALDKEQAVNWAKKLDAAGLVKGLPGASQGAYGLAVNAGNSAGANSMAAGNNYMNGMNMGASTIGQGRQMYQSGLSNILGAQGSTYANAPQDQTGQMVGAGLGALAAVAMMSDRRLKRDIVRLGSRPDGLNVYAYEYVWGGGMQVGVMADEVAELYPAAVIKTRSGYFAVDYGQL